MHAPHSRTPRIGIVGGGPGGLFTAYHLQRRAGVPFRTTIFEAAPRLGGKIVTKRFAQTAAHYEAGAAELYDYSATGEDALRELVAELGLPTTPMRGSAVVLRNRVLSNLDDVRAHLGPAARAQVEAFDRWARDRVSPHEFYQSDDGTGRGAPQVSFERALARVTDPCARRYLEALIHSDLATEPSETNLTYGLHNYVMNAPAYMQLYSISGGNERLVHELAARTRAEVLTEHRVARVGRSPTGELSVTALHADGEITRAFDFVVVALPNSYLPRIAFEGGKLTDAVRAHHDHHNHPAHYLRVTALFDRPFWRGAWDDSYCMSDAFGGCCLYDESSREPGASHFALGWLLGGKAACELSAKSDAELVDAVLGALPPVLAPNGARVLEAHVHRWVGSVSALPGGAVPRSLDRAHRPEPEGHPNLFFVGDYLFDSTLNGVLDSAEYAAEGIAERLERGSCGRGL
jgi:monoamine oxidase